MYFSRILYLATTAGIVGYFYQSQTQNKQLNTKQLKLIPVDHINVAKLYSAATTRLKEYLYTSILDQCRLNFSAFEQAEKNAELEPESTGDDADDGPPIPPIFPMSCPIPVEATRHAMHPTATRSFHTHNEDVRVYFDTRTKTPFWTVERINKCNLAAVQHNHCEDFKVTFHLSSDFKFGCPKNNTVFSVQSLEVPQVRKFDAVKDACGTIITKERKVCDFCEQAKIWKIFHEYLKFLIIQHDTINVCSGLLYLPEAADGACIKPNPDAPVRTFTVNNMKPSHYFKVLACRGCDGSVRFECYKFKIDQSYDKHTLLKDYIVPREQLEKDLGFTVFETFPQRDIDADNARTHVGFTLRQKEKKQREEEKKQCEEEKKKREACVPMCPAIPATPATEEKKEREAECIPMSPATEVKKEREAECIPMCPASPA